MSLLAGLSSVLAVHAHPDDETLSTGALLAHMAAGGAQIWVLTCTRGERGEVVPGPLAQLAGTPELTVHRADELRRALAVLGVSRHAYLGTDPARKTGLAQRIYRDSGMVWVSPTVAGPVPDGDEQALTAADIADPVADLAALLDVWRPDVVITYDADGGYGHPDHIRVHQICAQACGSRNVKMLEVIPPDRPTAGLPGIEWLDLSAELTCVQEALRQHVSQLTVHGAHVVHSGGQREDILLRCGLREHHATDNS